MHTVFLVFPNKEEARQYRHDNGTGGWIFDPEDNQGVVLFPPEIPPSQILNHPITRGRTGHLIGSQ
jgi:hypothetical protein